MVGLDDNCIKKYFLYSTEIQPAVIQTCTFSERQKADAPSSLNKDTNYLVKFLRRQGIFLSIVFT